MANSTPEDLILMLYNEMSEAKKAALLKELEYSWSLREKYNVLAEAAERLDTMPLQSPRHQTMEAILQYAQKTVKEVS